MDRVSNSDLSKVDDERIVNSFHELNKREGRKRRVRRSVERAVFEKRKRGALRSLTEQINSTYISKFSISCKLKSIRSQDLVTSIPGQ